MRIMLIDFINLLNLVKITLTSQVYPPVILHTFMTT